MRIFILTKAKNPSLGIFLTLDKHHYDAAYE